VDSSQDVTISGCFFSVGDDDIALKGSKGPFAMDDKDSPPVERIRIRDCTFEAGGGIVTCGSEATIVRDVEIERCTTKNKLPVIRLKLRPDTPQHYENIHARDITLEGEGPIFAVASWKQYFDLKGQPEPKSIVRNISVTGVKGSYGSFGKINGNANSEISDILVKDADLTLKDPKFEAGDIKGLRFENVVVNGAPMSAPEK
jgi:alpha-L-rhamnosidase